MKLLNRRREWVSRDDPAFQAMEGLRYGNTYSATWRQWVFAVWRGWLEWYLGFGAYQ